MINIIKRLFKQMMCEHVWRVKGHAKKKEVTYHMDKCMKCGKDRCRKE